MIDEDYIAETIEISLEELGLKDVLSSEAIKRMSADLSISIDCYNDHYCAPVENPLNYEIKEIEKKHKREIEEKERQLDNIIRNKNDIIRDRNISIWRLQDKLEERQ